MNKQTRVLRLSVFSVMAAAAYLLLSGASAAAFSNTYPDLADTSGAANVFAVSSNTQYVQQSNGAVRIWFPNNNGSIVIQNGHFCNSNSHDYIETSDGSWGSFNDGQNVTKFQATGTGINVTKYGEHYKNSGTVANCNNNITFNFTNIQQKQNGYYWVDLDISYVADANPGWDGAMNYFRIVAPGQPNVKIGLPGGATGHTTTQEQVDTTPAYTNYLVPFGTPCGNTSNETATVTLYDLDNAGGGGAQPASGAPVKVRLYNITDGAYVNFAGGTGTTWTPADTQNAAQSKSFTSSPGKKYRLEILDVFWNNTIQYSIPYSQIFREQCVPDWTLTGTSTANPPMAGPGDSVVFNHEIKNTGPDNMDADLKAYTEWFGSTGPGAVNGTQLENCDKAGGLNNGATKNCNNTFSIPPSAENGDKYCQRIVYKPKTPGETNWKHSTVACVTVSKMSCQLIPLGNVGEPGGSFTITFGVTGTPIAPHNLVYAIIQPAGPNITGNTTTATTVTRTINNAAAGTYTINWTFTNGDQPPHDVTTCTDTVTVNAKPYVRVYNGDVNAFAALPAGCGATTNPSNIRTFNKGSAGGGGYAGSGAQVAAIASGAIDQFVSLAVDPSSAANPIQRTFANVSGGYGGNFDAAVTCIPDYWTNIPSGAPTSATIGTTTIGGPTAPVYVDGDVHITGTGIRFDQTAVPLDNLPSYWVITTGNIYIEKTVTQLDGVYVARGTIYTCTEGANTPSEDLVSNRCGTQLTINGAFIADKVKLLRTANSLRVSAPHELRGVTRAAEVFTFSPDLWIGRPTTGGGGGTTPYDSVVSLPPVL